MKIGNKQMYTLDHIVPPVSVVGLICECSFPCSLFPGRQRSVISPVVGAHPPVPLLKNRNPSLPVQSHRPRSPCNVAEACQTRQSFNIQSL